MHSAQDLQLPSMGETGLSALTQSYLELEPQYSLSDLIIITISTHRAKYLTSPVLHFNNLANGWPPFKGKIFFHGLLELISYFYHFAP